MVPCLLGASCGTNVGPSPHQRGRMALKAVIDRNGSVFWRIVRNFRFLSWIFWGGPKKLKNDKHILFCIFYDFL